MASEKTELVIQSIYELKYLKSSSSSPFNSNNSNDRLLKARGSKLFAVDPKTIQLVIQAASFLISLFGREDYSAIEKSLNEIGNWIKKVAKELNKISVLLEEIRNELIALRIYIDTAFSRDVEIAVLSCCESYVTNLTVLKEDPDSDTTKQIFIGTYLELQKMNGMLRRYGYVNILTVFYGFRVELDLARILKYSKDTQIQIARNYSSYFSDAMDTTLSGSIPNVIASLNNEIESIRRDFHPGHKGLAGTWWYRDNMRTNCRPSRPLGLLECETHWDEWRMSPSYDITGSLDQGFDVVVSPTEIYRESGRNDYLEGQDSALDAARLYLRSDVLPSYNKACIRYKSLLGEIEGLSSLLEKCGEFKNVAENIVSMSD